MFRTHQGALWQTQKLPRGTDRKAKQEPKRGRPPTLLTEAEVLECRARSEFHGDQWPDWMLADHYGTTLIYMQRLLGYIVRGNLIAKPEHANLTSN